MVMPMTDPALSDAQQTQAMMDRIAHLRPASTAEALRALRSAFPEIPLAARDGTRSPAPRSTRLVAITAFPSGSALSASIGIGLYRPLKRRRWTNNRFWSSGAPAIASLRSTGRNG
jgi:hypothetical protein